MSPRKEVAAQIKSDNPDFTVLDFPASAPQSLGNGKVRVEVYRESFEVNSNNSAITHNLKALVIVSRFGSKEAEDELDAALDNVMLSLERLPDVYWQDAKRTTVADKFDGYEISLIAIRPQTYKSQLLTA